MLKKVKNLNVNTSNLYTGVLVMVEEYKEGEIVPAKAKILHKIGNSTYTEKSIRKIVYEKNSPSVDLQGRLSKKNNYSYPVINFEEPKTLKNNILAIKELSGIGELLTLAGLPKTLKTKKEIKKVFKLLSEGQFVVKLDGRREFVDPTKTEEINNQFVNASVFYKSKYEIEPQEKEKQMKKTFK